ncbi:MAG: flagellar export protein FliJ [Deltaproteobacteria bacterium]|nr:flagellar export protein FliJ [Deltaproteobacteria bacterium]MBZ0219293.1 flagellar export protein FliJ [Deltaproteobacteria bacterium]
MKKFTFTLEPLFNYRQRLEDLCRKGFEEALGLLKEEEKKIERLKDLYRQSSAEIDALKEKGEATGELDLHYAYVDGLKKHIADQERILREVNLLAERKRGELVEASKNRKVIEAFKERSLESYNKEARRKEQNESDELVTLRYGRNGDEK